MLTHKRAPLLMEGENVALEIEHSGVGPTAALPGTPPHSPVCGVSLHMLLQVIFALQRFLAHVTHCFLW